MFHTVSSKAFVQEVHVEQSKAISFIVLDILGLRENPLALGQAQSTQAIRVMEEHMSNDSSPLELTLIPAQTFHTHLLHRRCFNKQHEATKLERWEGVRCADCLRLHTFGYAILFVHSQSQNLALFDIVWAQPNAISKKCFKHSRKPDRGIFHVNPLMNNF